MRRGDKALLGKGNFKRIPFPALAALVVAFLFGTTHGAFAQTSTLGDVVCSIYSNVKPFGNVFAMIAYVAGAAFTVQGIHHLRLHSSNPTNNPLNRGLMLLSGASGLFVLPSVIGMIESSLYTVSGGGLTACSAGGVSAASASTGLDTMLSSFVGNIKDPLVAVISLTAILSGLYMVIRGLVKASKYGFDPKTHSVNSILAHLGFGSLLLTIGDNVDMMVNSVFGQDISGSSVITWRGLSSLAGGVSPEFINAVNAGLTFVQIIGAIAFVRGWMIMKKVVEGGGNVTLAQGLTHIFGGVLAINIYQLLLIKYKTYGKNMLQ
jgi:hypothetical protein